MNGQVLKIIAHPDQVLCRPRCFSNIVVKKLSFHLIWILPLLSSCYDYEEDTSVIQYDRKPYALSDVLMEDWGGHTETHYNVDFTFIGEHVTFEENQTSQGTIFYTLSDTIDCYIFVELFSPGAEKFTTGNFQRKGRDEFEELKDQHVFRRFLFGRSLDESIEAEDGNILVTVDSRGTYRIRYDVTLEDGKELTGKFAGQAIYSDLREQ